MEISIWDILLPVLRFLHQLSAVIFFILGTTFFAAFVLLRNDIATPWPAYWMQIADLPLALTAILYGGLSFFLSMQTQEKKSVALAYSVAIPLSSFFLLLVFLKFWTR